MSKIDSLRQAIRKAPNNLPLLLLHAHACLDDGQLDEAYSSLQEVLEQDKTHREARLGVARILFLNSKVSEAVVRAESLLKEDPSYAPAHMLLSRLFLQEKDRARAFSHYRQGMASDSSLSDLELEREFIREIRELRKAPLRGVKIAKAEVESEEEDWNGAASGSEGFGQADSENYQDDFDGDDDSNWSSGFISPREPIYSAVNFRHIGGYEKVKEALRVKMIYPLKSPDLARAYGSKIGGSVLLYGPAGCGKSLMAEAVAGECNAGYIHVGLHELLDPTLGSPERNLHQLFDFARSNTPSVLVLDHVESLVMNRRDISDLKGRYLVNQLLEELDFCIPGNEGLLVIGITDEPWALDPAALRPGRFAQPLFMGPPDRAERETIINLLTSERPVAGIDSLKLSELTEGFTGADIEALFNLASESCIAHAWKEGDIRPVSMEDIAAALIQVSPTVELWKKRAKEMLAQGSHSSFKEV